ncbi:hypothetical protein SCUCBS95973_002928 [Sporothrix curviconia]|uniref:2EXR domain-containing protein n=1 Tax=Sporothrix curviconia TaxID=1260050 RepID=A0ABP0BB16_9PEZI
MAVETVQLLQGEEREKKEEPHQEPDQERWPPSPTIAERLMAADRRLAVFHDQALAVFMIAHSLAARFCQPLPTRDIEDIEDFSAAFVHKLTQIRQDGRRCQRWTAKLTEACALEQTLGRWSCRDDPGTDANTPSDFPQFPRLPPEIQGKIFATAAEPPQCPHYYAGFDLALGGNEPSAEFMVADRALWTVCKEARWQVRNEYRKAAQQLAGGDQSACVFGTRAAVQLHRGLGYLNETAVVLFQRMAALPFEQKVLMHYAQGRARAYLAVFKHVDAATLEHELRQFDPQWQEGEVPPTDEAMLQLRDQIIHEFLTVP